jgi:hypothetical protein
MTDPAGGHASLIAARLAVLLSCAAVAGCAGPAVACPAIGYVPDLVVDLADDWPPAAGLRLVIHCDGQCNEVLVEDGTPGPGTDELTVPLGTGQTHVPWTTTPDSVSLTVLGADGAVLTELDADPAWVRVGGSEECGGPMQATVVVPRP